MSDSARPADTVHGLPRRLFICVTFHFQEARLRFLARSAAAFASLGKDVEVCIVTNAGGDTQQAMIRQALLGRGFAFRIVSPTLIGHPYLLTWCHLAVFRDRFACDATISHFLYLEDDLGLTRENLLWWLRAREDLRPFGGLYPSFMRFEERDGDTRRFSTDVTRPLDARSLPRIDVSPDYSYINIPALYQGMYLLDRELMSEHLSGPSSSPDHGMWQIRERATQALSFSNVPRGCRSRNLVGYRTDLGQIDAGCLIHHLPNNYANNQASPHGSIPIAAVIDPVYAGAVADEAAAARSTTAREPASVPT